MKIIFSSDWHLAKGFRPEVLNLIGYLRVTRPDILILGGDIGDPWEATWGEIVSSHAWAELYSLCEERKEQGLTTYWIAYNHDYNAKQEYLPAARIVKGVRIANRLFMHGYEFSLDWGWGPIDNIAFWIAKRFPKIMVPIYHLLFTTPGSVKREGHTPREKWSLGTATGHTRARHFAQKTGLFVCIGHFHCRTLDEGFFCDAGHNVGSTSWLEIADDKEELKTL